MKLTLKNAINFTAAFLLLASARCFGAAWEGADDFSAGISPANWHVYSKYKGEMTVMGTNGHASFIVAISTNTEQNAFVVWRGTPTAAEDWAVEILGHNSAFHPSCQLQLAVLNNDKPWTNGTAEGLVVAMSNNSSGPGKFGTSWWHFPGGSTRRATNDTTSTDFSLRLIYRAASQTVEAWCDPTASAAGWTKLDSMTLAEISPGMTTTNTFAFAVLGNTDYGPISEGEIWADDFRVRISPPRLFVTGAQLSAGLELLHLTWTNNGSALVLEGAGSFTGGWTTVSSPWTTNAGWVSTIATNPSPAQFYRLKAN